MSVIDELLDLQEQDSVIKSLEKQVHDIPKRRKLEQEKLDDYRRERGEGEERREARKGVRFHAGDYRRRVAVPSNGARRGRGHRPRAWANLDTGRPFC